MRRLERHGDRIIGLMTDKGAVSGDAYVLALGSYSPLLARPLGVEAADLSGEGLFPHLAHRRPARARRSIGGVDEGNLVAYATPRRPAAPDRHRRFRRLRHRATRPRISRSCSMWPASCFPTAAPMSKPGLLGLPPPHDPRRPADHGPMRADRNLWINTGHGHMGWTMAAGCSRIVVDLIAGRAPAIDIAGLTLDRY